MEKFLYIGYAVDRKLEKELKGISVAGNKMQVNFLREMCRCLGENLYAITIYPVSAYPLYKKLLISYNIQYICDEECLDGKRIILNAKVPFIFNLPIIKNLFEIYSTYRSALKLVSKHNIDTIILFNSFPPTAFAAQKLKKKFGCKVICLLADLPIDDSIKTNGIKKILRNIFQNYTERAIKKTDKLIVLNSEVVNLYAPDIPYIVVEGAVRKSDIPPFKYICSFRKNIVFTGALQKYNGIVELIEAMKLLKNSNVELDIYGQGEFLDYVKEACEEYSNIHYCGFCSNEEIMQIQREAYLLINPRPTDDFIAKVTFPSKIFEYMTSGTPVLSTKLNGYTQEFIDNMYIIEENTPQCIADTIESVTMLSDNDLKEKAYSAYKMIVETKNWKMQTEKIINFINQ